MPDEVTPAQRRTTPARVLVGLTTAAHRAEEACVILRETGAARVGMSDDSPH